MSEENTPMIEHFLLEDWRRRLPEYLNPSDEAQVVQDGHDPDLIRIHIETEGRTGYTFDFTVRYRDDREIEVTFVDVDKDQVTVDEHTDEIQAMIKDYVRHIHECAQLLQRVTHA